MGADRSGIEQLVADINALLAGSYDPIGIARWWSRPRTTLNGRTPHDVIQPQEFDPAGTDAGTLRQLAASLAGAGTAT